MRFWWLSFEKGDNYLDKHRSRHRIDGLEKCPLEPTEEAGVRHRIDGLESYDVVNGQVLAVRHRIDGLENG